MTKREMATDPGLKAGPGGGMGEDLVLEIESDKEESLYLWITGIYGKI